MRLKSLLKEAQEVKKCRVWGQRQGARAWPQGVQSTGKSTDTVHDLKSCPAKAVLGGTDGLEHHEAHRHPWFRDFADPGSWIKTNAAPLRPPCLPGGHDLPITRLGREHGQIARYEYHDSAINSVCQAACCCSTAVYACRLTPWAPPLGTADEVVNRC